LRRPHVAAEAGDSYMGEQTARVMIERISDSASGFQASARCGGISAGLC